MERVLKKIFLLLAEKLVAELTFTEGCANSTELLFACCSSGWGQAGQGQWNVTVWKLVSWNVKGFQVCLFFPCGVCIVVCSDLW